jgi:hypothetical protein
LKNDLCGKVQVKRNFIFCYQQFLATLKENAKQRKPSGSQNRACLFSSKKLENLRSERFACKAGEEPSAAKIQIE